MVNPDTAALAEQITARHAKRNVTETRVGIGYKDQTLKPFYYVEQIKSLIVNEDLIPASLTSAVDQHNQSVQVLRSRWEKLIEGPPLDPMSVTLEQAKQMGHTRRDAQLAWLKDFAVVAEVQRDLFEDSVIEWDKEVEQAETELAKQRKRIESDLERAGFTKQAGGGLSPRRGVPQTVARRQIDFQVRRAPVVAKAEQELKHFAMMQSECRKEAKAAEQRRQDCLDELQRVISEAMN